MENEVQAVPSLSKFFGNSEPVDSDQEGEELTKSENSDGAEEIEEEAETSEDESSEEGAEAAVDDESKEDEEETQDDKDYQALYEDAETKRKSFQSRADQLGSLNSQLLNENAGLKNHIQQQTAPDKVLEGIDDEEILTVAMAKKLLAGQNNQRQEVPVYTGGVEAALMSRPDFAEVDTFVKENGIEVSQILQLSGAADDISRYNVLSQHLAEKKNKDLNEKLLQSQVDIKKLKARKAKPKVPSSGPGGSNPRKEKPSIDKGDRLGKYFLT